MNRWIEGPMSLKKCSNWQTRSQLGRQEILVSWGQRAAEMKTQLEKAQLLVITSRRMWAWGSTADMGDKWNAGEEVGTQSPGGWGMNFCEVPQNSDSNTGGEGKQTKILHGWWLPGGTAGVLTYAVHLRFAGWLEWRVTITLVPGAYGGGRNPFILKREKRKRFQDTENAGKERMLSSSENNLENNL